MKIISIQCPTCGANLSADDEESRITCDFCGGLVVVEDARREGYNNELGRMKARANISEELARSIDELIEPLCETKNTEEELKSLNLQKKSFESQISILEKHSKVISYGAAGIFSLLFFIILTAAKAPVGVFIFFGLLCAAAFPAIAFVVMKYWDNIVKGLKETDEGIAEHEKLLREFERIKASHKDISIPEKYQERRAMNFIRDSIRSQTCPTIQSAISEYEKLLRDEKALALQEEQIRLQQQQIEETRKLQNIQSNPNARQQPAARPRVVRQKGHSIILHILLCFVWIGFFTIPYYSISKKHYWHI